MSIGKGFESFSEYISFTTVSSTGDCHYPAQMPPVPTFCKFFVTVCHQPEANELLVAFYIVILNKFKEVRLIFFDCVHDIYEPRRSGIFLHRSFA